MPNLSQSAPKKIKKNNSSDSGCSSDSEKTVESVEKISEKPLDTLKEEVENVDLKRKLTELATPPAKFQKKDKTPNTPFRRVKDEEELDENYLKKFGKNAFDNKRGAEGSWGEKANKDLIHTRGKSFRHEKTKKKRGSYRGGKIDLNTYSIKFDESS